MAWEPLGPNSGCGIDLFTPIPFLTFLSETLSPKVLCSDGHCASPDGEDTLHPRASRLLRPFDVLPVRPEEENVGANLPKGAGLVARHGLQCPPKLTRLSIRRSAARRKVAACLCCPGLSLAFMSASLPLPCCSGWTHLISAAKPFYDPSQRSTKL